MLKHVLTSEDRKLVLMLYRLGVIVITVVIRLARSNIATRDTQERIDLLMFVNIMQQA